ncbi:MAG TPA: glutathione S-transferase family protein, partial [Candidatus Binataceae bacterium]|nr:glutathione S-transferase family protein [Candidatus Binataceae bacterium]
MGPLTLVGGYGSPYSRKMRAVLRYRRIPFRWIMRGSAEDVGIPPVPVALIPVLVFPGENGATDEAMIDSTFEIARLEAAFKDRSLIPRDRALAFLHALIEDYGDEWLTKPMFHYRWNYAADIHKASHVLILDRMPHVDDERLARAAKTIADRQIARLGVVGSNATTRPVIEDSYRRLLDILDRHVASGALCLMGTRPGVGDFGLFGQLSQLTHFDPTPSATAAEHAPRVFSWVNRMEDLSSIDVSETGWNSRAQVGEALNPLL